MATAPPEISLPTDSEVDQSSQNQEDVDYALVVQNTFIQVRKASSHLRRCSSDSDIGSASARSCRSGSRPGTPRSAPLVMTPLGAGSNADSGNETPAAAGSATPAAASGYPLPPATGSTLLPASGRATEVAADEQDGGGTPQSSRSVDLLYVVCEPSSRSESSHDDIAGPPVEVVKTALPSRGSAKHHDGTCQPCSFNRLDKCLLGTRCEHCHFSHEGAKRMGKKARNREKTRFEKARMANEAPSGEFALGARPRNPQCDRCHGNAPCRTCLQAAGLEGPEPREPDLQCLAPR